MIPKIMWTFPVIPDVFSKTIQAQLVVPVFFIPPKIQNQLIYVIILPLHFPVGSDYLQLSLLLNCTRTC